ncbi:hypothetical protein SNEBB_001980 [Seison nebaliae]|nr:hypothetical protein SNEBB_001980 [Seison nebaliae]
MNYIPKKLKNISQVFTSPTLTPIEKVKRISIFGSTTITLITSLSLVGYYGGRTNTKSMCRNEIFDKWKDSSSACSLPSKHLEGTLNNSKISLKIHNEFRRESSLIFMSLMKWDKYLATLATGLSESCSFKHDSHKKRYDPINPRLLPGQNIAIAPITSKWRDVIELWLLEEKNFRYGTGRVLQSNFIEHYSQVMTSSAVVLGCSVSVCKVKGKLKKFYVCNYLNGLTLETSKRPFYSTTGRNRCGKCKHCVKNLCYCNLMELRCPIVNYTNCECSNKKTFE